MGIAPRAPACRGERTNSMRRQVWIGALEHTVDVKHVHFLQRAAVNRTPLTHASVIAWSWL